jgi:hypothetical protein
LGATKLPDRIRLIRQDEPALQFADLIRPMQTAGPFSVLTPPVRRPELEGDVQDVWFRSLRVERGKLLIENERGERFEVDPATRHVLGHPAAPAVEPKPDIDPISGEPRIRRPG